MVDLTIPVVYTFIILIEVAMVWIRSTDFFYYFHDWFASENLAGPGYMDQENWRAVLRAAVILALLMLAVVWLLSLLDKTISIVGGFGAVVLYQLFLGAVISDEIEDSRREKGDWRYGWY
ncbi:hypothetical protein [Thermococcus siculi]|uniref:hypothetical protein n=1 Tax=Thermococcus siculi TaxID=72803 RepID=UPI0012FD103C|nr:hypothetical protein [Thermococcus siculi]